MDNIADFQEDFAAIFEEWARRYKDDPKNFQKIEDLKAHTYGERAARYFIRLWGELSEVVK